MTLKGKTPDEVYSRQGPANELPRFVPRKRWPRGSPCATPQTLVKGQRGVKLELYSMDRQWLAETGYPVVAEIFKFYRANLREEADGRLHIPISSSPECRGSKPEAWGEDPNIDIALIRRTCDWVVEMEEALGKSGLTASAKQVHAQLAPYHLTAQKELCLWAGKPLDA